MVVVGEGGTRDKVNWGKKKLSVREGLLKKGQIWKGEKKLKSVLTSVNA